MRESENTNPVLSEDEKNFEQNIRPKTFSDFTGQKKLLIISKFLSARRLKEAKV